MKITDITELLLLAEAPRAEDLTRVCLVLEENFPGATIKIEGTTTLEKFISLNKDQRKIFVLFSKKGLLEVKDFTGREVPADLDWRYHFLAKRESSAIFETVEEFIIGLKNVLA